MDFLLGMPGGGLIADSPSDSEDTSNVGIPLFSSCTLLVVVVVVGTGGWSGSALVSGLHRVATGKGDGTLGFGLLMGCALVLVDS